ncbi:MAG: cytochrome P450 [Acidimicrobiia bacterium]
MTDQTRTPVVDFDVFASNTLAANNAAWEAVRTECPVGWTQHNGGHWVISGYEAVAEAFRSWEVFSSARPNPEYASITISNSRIPPLIPEELDPPEWHPVRRILAGQLSPGAAERLRPRARHWARRCIDEVIETGRCELVTGLAFPVPAAVTLEWLGFPESDWEAMAHAFHDPSAHPNGSPEHRRAFAAFAAVTARVAEEVALRTRSPRDDALTAIVQSEIEGERIPSELAEALVFMTIGGGVDTTSALSAAALWHLHAFPEDRARLLAEPELLEPATEEFLRFYPPARTHARTVTQDVEFAGCPMHAGDRVLLSEIAAGRDHEAFPDADRFVIDRFPNRHLSFGAGIHRCPGSHLARITFTEIMREVLDRIPDYRIVDAEVVEYPNWSMIGGWANLPAVFTPGPRLG